MRRRISTLLAVALATVGFTVLGPPQPATAWTLCGGTGTATVDHAKPGTTGILYPVGITMPSKDGVLMFDVLLGDAQSDIFYNFSFKFTPVGGTDNCVHPTTSPPGVDTTKDDPDPTASGVVKGYCGLSSGTGTFPANGDLFAWIGVGGTLILTGHLVGVVNAVPDAGAGQSCTHGTSGGTSLDTGGALIFTINGAVLLLNCTPDLQTLVPGTPGDFTTLIPGVTFQTLTPTFHVLVNLGIHYFWNHQCVGSPVL